MKNSTRRAHGAASLPTRARLAAAGILSAIIAFAAAGCGSDPIQAPSGFQAAGMALVSGGSDLVLDSATVHGSIQVAEGQTTNELTATFIGKTDLKRTLPTGTGYTLDAVVADGTIASVEVTTAPWAFKVHGLKAGSTTVTFKLMSGTTVAFTSSAIPVTVTPAVHGLAVGDTAVYTVRDRDSVNQVVPGSDRKRTWVVMQGNLSLYGKTGVMQVLESTYDAAGATVASTDTLYIQMDADGSFYQYDMLRRLLARVSNGDSFSSSLTPLWVKMSNVSLATASSWSAIGVDSQVVKNVTTPAIPTALDITFRLPATHKGTQSATVPAGTYAAAVHTDMALKLLVKPSALPITALNDSLLIHVDASSTDGLLRQVVESKILVASVLTITQTLPVSGFEMELQSVHRKK
ncbi:MAG TPA: hypothetical protein VHI13_02940 [Candidatus Kapabacteria bacterium]|nr:hypothetical protein [Candidatus Kapabacteria bacterium]